MPAGSAIDELLAGRYRDPDTGAVLSTTVRAVAIEDDLRDREVDLLAGLDLGGHLAVVSDPDTERVLGARVARALASRYRVQVVSLPPRSHADEATLERLVAAIAPGVDAIVAIGSGTINDLCKLVALRRGCPQVVFATAPSMNGYASGYASLTVDGLKRSVRAGPPDGVFFDLAVIAAAPIRMIHAGLGDSLCRSTAQADWLLAHLLVDGGYRSAPFALLAADEAVLLDDAAALVGGDRAALASLCRTLVLSGFGMSICGGSYPASQGEHLISHYLEMMRPAGAPSPFHGEQVGVATLSMARLQTAILDRDRPLVVGASPVTEDDVRGHFGPALGPLCWSEFAPKRLDRAGAEARNARLDRDWDRIRAAVGAVALGAARIEAALAAAGAPRHPVELGCSAADYDHALRYARMIRNRYTFLDLAAELTD